MSALPSPRLNRNTGFPEPFNGDRNTTLPYPGAQIGPNATLGTTQNDHLFELRTRRTFQSQMKRISTFRHNRISTSSFTLDAGLLPSVGPTAAPFVISPTSSGHSVEREMENEVGGNPRASTASSLDLGQLAALASAGERPGSSDSAGSEGSKKRGLSKLFARGRKVSQ